MTRTYEIFAEPSIDGICRAMLDEGLVTNLRPTYDNSGEFNWHCSLTSTKGDLICVGIGGTALLAIRAAIDCRISQQLGRARQMEEPRLSAFYSMRLADKDHTR